MTGGNVFWLLIAMTVGFMAISAYAIVSQFRATEPAPTRWSYAALLAVANVLLVYMLVSTFAG